MSLFDLTGQVAVVTGSSKGIGLGVARQMAAHGARVVVSSRDQNLCDEVAAGIGRDYGRGERIAVGIASDLDRLEDGERLASAAREVWGRIDALVCNAAIFGYLGPPGETPPEVFDRVLSGNIHHNFRLCEAFRPDLAKTRGSITLIGSGGAHVASPRTLAYSAAKAAIVHMTRSLADEYAAEGIRVNCVAPGLIRSFTSTETLGDAVLSAAGQRIPLGRVGEPEDIAGAVIFMASKAGEFVTAQTILVDGGSNTLTPSKKPSAFDSVTREFN
jgi:NAD(P)-dependent dehydrogenase (short-subunit alcohol dehydrogenase family)